MSKVDSLFLTAVERQGLIKQHRLERDGRLRDRLKTVLLLDRGWSYGDIAQALFLDDQTIRNYEHTYQQSGLASLLDLQYQGRVSKLTVSQAVELKAYLDEVTYLTADSIVAYISQTYGVVYHRKGLIDVLHRLGFVYKKPKLVPGNPDPERQAAFITMYQELKENLCPTDEIVFMDAVHPQHNARAGYGWMLKGKTKELATNSGRQRLNITGALNVRRMEIVTRYDDKHVNTYSITDVLFKLLNTYPHAKNIYVILDNAAYHHAKVVKGLFEKTRIRLLFLPPYSPNLNLIERL